MQAGSTGQEAAVLDRRPKESAAEGRSLLICGVASLLCGLPLKHVTETMRALPVDPVVGSPEFVMGVSVVRGEPVPVLDASRLLAAVEGKPTRYVSIDAAGRRVVLAVDSVIGIRELTDTRLRELPPLLAGSAADGVRSLVVLDAELLLILEEGRLVPDSVWASIDRGPAS